MRNEKPLQVAKSVRDLKQRMAGNPVYEQRHYDKVDVAYEHFQQRFKEAGVKLPASVEEVP